MQVFWKAWEVRHRREGKGLSWEDGEGGFQGISCVPHVTGHGFRSEQRDGLKRRTHWQLSPRSLTPDPYTIFRLSAQDVRVSLPESVFVPALSWLSTARLLFTLPHLLRKCPRGLLRPDGSELRSREHALLPGSLDGRGAGENGYTNMYGWVALLCPWIYQDIVNQIYANIKSL